MSHPLPLFREHELAFRTQYAEVKERVLAQGRLLPGTAGSLVLRKGTGYGYWYRVFYPVPGKQVEDIVCAESDVRTLTSMEQEIAFASWVARQVGALRKLGFQVADKATGRVLVELHNRQAFESGIVLVGTLAWAAWMNELGASVVAARTLDIDVAVRSMKLAVPLDFLESMRATTLPFHRMSGPHPAELATSVKLPGVQGLRVDVFAPGTRPGEAVRVRDLGWAAQSVPFYDWLLEAPEAGAVLAGGHCVPVRLPQAARFVWHKLYSSTQRRGFPEKAEKDRWQALLLAAVLAEQDSDQLVQALSEAPKRLLMPVRPLLPRLMSQAERHPALRDILSGRYRGA
ncbi:MAG: hypothetical protein LT106_05030 [Burkholderiaceae bacterium]|nr:hypothetical protein [Burkholderiaceae bacterium]